MPSNQNRDLCIMACIFCRDPEFKQWAEQMSMEPVKTDAAAQKFIQAKCGVESRKDLDTNKAAAERFHVQIRIPFGAWKESRQK